MTFQTAVDIANRGLQHVGATRIVAFTDDSKQASEVSFCYDKVRRAELRRNVWRFAIRTTALRPIGDDDKLITFGAYASGTTYVVNDVVKSAVDNQIYFSVVGSNIGHEPSASPAYWALYFGPVIADEFVTSWSATIAYAIGDHTIGSDGAGYIATVATTNNNPISDAGAHWSLAPNDPDVQGITYNSTQSMYFANAQTYFAGEMVHIGSKVYISKQNQNQDSPLYASTVKWLVLSTQPTIALLNFIYPIGAGPWADGTTKNAYRLPNGFLREAPQDPKAGQALFLGAPDGSSFDDWNFESDYFTSANTGVIAFRFVADISDVTRMDDMFCEGLAARIAMEIAETLTQSTTKVTTAASMYKGLMSEARLVNFIETGPVYPPEDSYISCRY